MASFWDYLPARGSGRPYLEKAAREVWRFIPPELRGKVQASGELAEMLMHGSGTVQASQDAPQVRSDIADGNYGSAGARAATGILGMAADWLPPAKLAMAAGARFGKGILGRGPDAPAASGPNASGEADRMATVTKPAQVVQPMPEASDVARRLTPDETRQVSKYLEKFGQRVVIDGDPTNMRPIGNWSEFIRSPEYHRRVDEMYQAGKDYMSRQPTPVWFDGPAFQRVYGDRAPVFTDLIAATAPNTSLTPNLRHASEYMRRHILGEPLVQPNFRTPEGLMAQRPDTKMPIEQSRAANLRRIEQGTPEQLQRDKVSHEARGLRGDLTAAPIDRHLVRSSEDPARGIYAISDLSNFYGKPYGELYDQFAVAAQRHSRSIRDFVADVYVGIRNHVRDHNELFGAKFRPGSVRGESKSYNDLFEDLLEQGAQIHRMSKRDFERRLASGDVTLLSGFLAVPAVAGLLSEISAENSELGNRPDL